MTSIAKQPLVSIIIPAYNYADYVSQAIESALGQTYPNVEVIVINDGSSDNTADVISKYADRATVINQENQGVIATRNTGVRLAHGKYVMQLDADDFLDPQYVAKCVSLAEAGADVVYTQVRHFGRADFNSEYIAYDLEKLKHSNYIHASSLVRASKLPKDPYDKYLEDKGYEDWDVFLGLCLDGAKAVLLNEPVLHYRKHENANSRSDVFGGTKKEVLARHHIWSKQNAKHPDDFWYFSSEIDLMLSMVHLYEAHDKMKVEHEHMSTELTKNRKRLRQLEMRDPISLTRKAGAKAGRYVKRRLAR